MPSYPSTFPEEFPTCDNKTLAYRYGVSPNTINTWAVRSGLKKDASYLKEMRRRRATGRILGSESREKIGRANRGRTLTAETKAKIAQTKIDRGSVPKGENHYKWKGGKPWERFKDPDYITWRNSVLERDKYICRDCGRRCNKNEKGLAAHHLKPYATHPELRFDVSNGVTLCRGCHMERHGRAPAPKDPIPCACGCGTMIAPFDKYSNRPRRFVNGHGKRIQKGRAMTAAEAQRRHRLKRGSTGRVASRNQGDIHLP